MAQNNSVQQNFQNQPEDEDLDVEQDEPRDNAADAMQQQDEPRDNAPDAMQQQDVPAVQFENHNAIMNNNPSGASANNVNRPLVGAVAGVPNRNLMANGASAARFDNGAMPSGYAGRAVQHIAPTRPLYNWQATKATLKERFQYLHNNEILSDVRFIVGRGMQTQRIPAHKVCPFFFFFFESGLLD